MGEVTQQPSPRFGFAQARVLWRVVLAVWAVSIVVQLPPLLLLEQRTGDLGNLPLPSAQLPPGEECLVSYHLALAAAVPVGMLQIFGLVLWWLWTPLWHGGIVSWQVWVAGREVRLGEVLGMGITAWWRYLRLSLCSALVVVLPLVLVWLPLSVWPLTVSELTSGWWRALPVLALLATVGIVALSWAATLRGAWLLGLPGSASALRSWALGLVGATRAPVRTFATMAVWILPAVTAAALPLLLGFLVGLFRGGPGGLALSLLADLAGAFCQVALLCSFAPITGLVESGVSG